MAASNINGRQGVQNLQQAIEGGHSKVTVRERVRTFENLSNQNNSRFDKEHYEVEEHHFKAGDSLNKKEGRASEYAVPKAVTADNSPSNPSHYAVPKAYTNSPSNRPTVSGYVVPKAVTAEDIKNQEKAHPTASGYVVPKAVTAEDIKNQEKAHPTASGYVVPKAVTAEDIKNQEKAHPTASHYAAEEPIYEQIDANFLNSSDGIYEEIAGDSLKLSEPIYEQINVRTKKSNVVKEGFNNLKNRLFTKKAVAKSLQGNRELLLKNIQSLSTSVKNTFNEQNNLLRSNADVIRQKRADVMNPQRADSMNPSRTDSMNAPRTDSMNAPEDHDAMNAPEEHYESMNLPEDHYETMKPAQSVEQSQFVDSGASVEESSLSHSQS